jgi:Ca2+-binding EF-hand superfamily protein
MATSEQEMKEAFDTFDTDHTGTIHAADLGTVIRALGNGSPPPHRLFNINLPYCTGRAPLEKEIEAMLAEVGA